MTISSEEEKRIITNFFSKYGIQKKKYLLFPASYWTHKNHKLAIDAVSLMQNPVLVKIVCCGGLDTNRKKIEGYAREKGVERSFLFLGHVSRETLFVLYKHAQALLFPSQYEGFGIPISEAAQFKLPIIASDIPPTREIVGEHAAYFNVDNPLQLAEIIDRGIPDYMTKRGKKHAIPVLSWKKTLDGFTTVFETAIQSKN